ncbi:Myc-type, basic helix-loop-helix [Sesbania bispinosa]|nr:Myc-type, basic helix-loop-helix [Sesbania bispinosa]
MDHRNHKTHQKLHLLRQIHHGNRERDEVEAQDPTAARKVQKADREKLRRDRLNDHFHELGNALDPDRPRNDKATILTDAIQMLKDFTTEVNKLKMEHKALSEESRELMQEKNELREEKASLKSDIENLNAQYQQRVRIMFPWTAVEPFCCHESPYSYPVPIPIPPSPISMHPSLQPFPFFGNQNPGHIPSPCSMYVSFSAPTNPAIELPSSQYASTSHASNQKESQSKSPDHRRRPSDAERCSDSHDVATELELRCLDHQHNRKYKHSAMKDRIITDGSASSRYSSPQGLQDSSNSVGDTNIPKVDN